VSAIRHPTKWRIGSSHSMSGGSRTALQCRGHTIPRSGAFHDGLQDRLNVVGEEAIITASLSDPCIPAIHTCRTVEPSQSFRDP
jgi:hypothetical protein